MAREVDLGSIIGPQGPQGPEGPQGPKGEDGKSVTIKGSKESEAQLPQSGNTVGDGYIIDGNLHVWDGTKWNNVGKIQGPEGPQGPQGEKGEKGDTGAQGIQGETGPTGPKGDTGAQGPQGEKGDTGAQGPQGPEGEKGEKGDTGAKGDTGTRGSRWYQGTGITGESGTATAFPDSGITDALVNDNYLNTSTGNTYRCTVAGNASAAKWIYTGNLKGPTGPKGDTGAQGQAGSNGKDGITPSFEIREGHLYAIFNE